MTLKEVGIGDTCTVVKEKELSSAESWTWALLKGLKSM